MLTKEFKNNDEMACRISVAICSSMYMQDLTQEEGDTIDTQKYNPQTTSNNGNKTREDNVRLQTEVFDEHLYKSSASLFQHLGVNKSRHESSGALIESVYDRLGPFSRFPGLHVLDILLPSRSFPFVP